MQANRKQRLPRRSIQQTRELLLDAGAEFLDAYQRRSDAQVLSDALRHVRMPEILSVATDLEAHRHSVSDPAPITTGAAYHAFPGGEDEYRAALLEHVIATERTMDAEVVANELMSMVMDHGGEFPPIDEAIRRVTAAAYFHARRLAGVYTRIGFFAFAGHETLAELLAANYRDTIGAWGVSAMYETLLEQYGLRMRPPLTVQHLATTILALMEGFVLRSRVDPESAVDSLEWSGEDWPLFSIGCQAIIDHYTEPV